MENKLIKNRGPRVQLNQRRGHSGEQPKVVPLLDATAWHLGTTFPLKEGSKGNLGFL